MARKYPITVSSWTLGDQCKFEDRVIAAKKAGYDGIGLRAETYVDALAEGLHDEDILAILDKHGMKCTEVEYIVQWAEDNRSYEQKYKEQMCFHMCELFGVKQINCGLMENYSVEHTAQKLRELCQRAGKWIIGVEPMPYSGIPDIKKGWAVVKAADCENAKLILDTWSPAIWNSWLISPPTRSSPSRSMMSGRDLMQRASSETSPCTIVLHPAPASALLFPSSR